MNAISTICGTVLLVACVAAVAYLGYHGTIAGDAVVAVISAVIGIGGGAFAVHQGVKVGASAAESKPSK